MPCVCVLICFPSCRLLEVFSLNSLLVAVHILCVDVGFEFSGFDDGVQVRCAVVVSDVLGFLPVLDDGPQSLATSLGHGRNAVDQHVVVAGARLGWGEGGPQRVFPWSCPRGVHRCTM